MAIVFPKIIKKYLYEFVNFIIQVTFRVGCTSKATCEMTMISNPISQDALHLVFQCSFLGSGKIQTHFLFEQSLVLEREIYTNYLIA